MFRVKVLVRPLLPTAVTAAPWPRSREFPTAMGLNAGPPTVCSRARPWAGSVPTSRAGNDRPDSTTRTVIRRAPWRAWSLVSTRPEGVRMSPAPAGAPRGVTTCTRPGAAELRMFAWLSAPVPSSSSTNTLFCRGGLGITEDACAGPDRPPAAANAAKATTAAATAAPTPRGSRPRRDHRACAAFSAAPSPARFRALRPGLSGLSGSCAGAGCAPGISAPGRVIRLRLAVAALAVLHTSCSSRHIRVRRQPADDKGAVASQDFWRPPHPGG